MVVQKLESTGKFFLYNRKKKVYLNRKGTIDEGNGPVPYIYWTPYFSGAQGFGSRKTAEAMCRRLSDEGIHVSVVTEIQKGGKSDGKAE